MNFSGYVYLLAIFSVLAITGILLAAYIFANFRTGQSVREVLSKRIGALRLKKMLKLQGINFSDFLYGQLVHDIEKQVRACEGCNKTAECDQALKQHEKNANLQFCPNYESIRQHGSEPASSLKI